MSRVSLRKVRFDGVNKQEENRKQINSSVMCVATLQPARTLLQILQCVLSCHHNVVVSLLVLQVQLTDIPGVRSAGCLPRQTRGWA